MYLQHGGIRIVALNALKANRAVSLATDDKRYNSLILYSGFVVLAPKKREISLIGLTIIMFFRPFKLQISGCPKEKGVTP